MATGKLIHPLRFSITGRGGKALYNFTSNVGAHRFWRIKFNDKVDFTLSDYARIYIVKLFDITDSTVPALDLDNDIYTASSEYSTTTRANEAFLNAFKTDPTANTSTYWQSADVAFPHWLQVEFQSAKDIDRLEIWHGANMQDAPTDVELLWSDDGVKWYKRSQHYLSWPSTSSGTYYGDDYKKSMYAGDPHAYIANLDIPPLTLSGEVQVWNFYSADLAIPKPVTTGYISNTIGELDLGLEITGQLLTGEIFYQIISPDLPAMSLSGEIAGESIYSLASSLPRLTLQASGYQQGDSHGSSLPALKIQGTALTGRVGRIEFWLPSMMLNGSLQDDELSGNSLPTPGISGDMVSGVDFRGSIALSPPSLTGSLGDSASLPVPDISGELIPGLKFDGGGKLPRLSASGTLSVNGSGNELPVPTISGNVTQGEVISGNLTIPSLRITGGINTWGILPGLALAGELTSGIVSQISATLPALSLQASDFGDVPEIPIPICTGEIATGVILRLSARLPSISVSGFVENEALRVYGGSLGLSALSLSGYILQENLYAGSLQLNRLILAAEGLTGTVGGIELNIPAPSIDGIIFGENEVSAILQLPAIQVYATGIIQGDLVDTGSVGAISMNLQHKAVTEYTGYRFNSFARFGGVTLAANENGIFALTGDTDHGKLIESSARLGKLDFESSALKNIDYVYLGYTSDGDMSLKARADDKTEYSYPLRPRQIGESHTSRTKIGKGIKGRYWQFGMVNCNGADFSIDSIDLDTKVFKRRVR